MAAREMFPAICKRPLIIRVSTPLPVDIMIGKTPMLQYILPESKKKLVSHFSVVTGFEENQSHFR